jgi:hypothetical protein
MAYEKGYVHSFRFAVEKGLTATQLQDLANRLEDAVRGYDFMTVERNGRIAFFGLSVDGSSETVNYED